MDRALLKPLCRIQQVHIQIPPRSPDGCHDVPAFEELIPVMQIQALNVRYAIVLVMIYPIILNSARLGASHRLVALLGNRRGFAK